MEKAPIWKFWHWKMHWQVLAGIILGVFFGYFSGVTKGYGAERFDGRSYLFIGGMFMQALKMIVVPLVICSIIASICTLDGQKGFARLGGKTILYYIATSFFAIIIGVLLVNMIKPGHKAKLTKDEIHKMISIE